MRVAVISAEAVPYSKTGGLGDVAGALPKALKRVGVDSVLITPCYWQTKGEYLWNTAVDDLFVPWKGGTYHATGPVEGTLTMGAMLEACIRVASERGAPPAGLWQ